MDSWKRPELPEKQQEIKSRLEKYLKDYKSKNAPKSNNFEETKEEINLY